MSKIRVALASLLVIGGVSAPAFATDPSSAAGSQGTDTALAATDSAITVNGRGDFAALQITVNQTRSLTNQAVSITWTGGTPTRTSPGTFASDYLQIMQCWGEDDGTVPSNPGPPPEQCEFGAIGSVAPPPTVIYPDAYAVSRVVAIAGQSLDLSDGVSDGAGQYYRPFRAVDGTEIGVQVDPTFIRGVSGGNSWLNPYFNAVTTNEIAGAKTDQEGKGSELFEVQTGLQAAGLGCGQHTQPVGDSLVIPKCWLVIVPRGDALDENVGTTLVNAGPSQPVATSPLRSQSWRNRIAIPLEFLPVDSPCSLADEERRLAGSDLMQSAIASWQPVLCTTDGLPPYSFVPVGDAAARQQLSSSSAGGPGMIVVSKPLDQSQVDPSSPAVYAPIGLSGLTIGFHVERYPKSGNAAEAALIGTRVASMKLTPRLVAKLLTQSYRAQVSIGGSLPSGYSWALPNPLSMASDPDFVQFNPEFALLLSGDDRTFSGLQLPSGSSDAAEALWKWVLSDPEATAWLDGEPDAWGMRVNPAYSTSASVNPSGVGFGSPVPTNYPKADPYCYQAPPRGNGGSIIPPPLCGTDWMPYGRNYTETARAARIGFDGARIVENPVAESSSQVWSRIVPQYLGSRMMLSLTDTASAAQFGLQVAALSRAGDDGEGRSFILPTDAALRTAASAMVSSSTDAQVRVADPSSDTTGAYPLTLLSYAAVKPLSLDATARSEYASFIEYAVGDGQTPGFDLGDLPRGYVPLPDELKVQARYAAQVVRSMPPVPTTTTTVPNYGGGGGGNSSGQPTDTTVAPPSSESTTTTTPSSSTTAEVSAVTTPDAGGGGARTAMVGIGVAFVGSALGALELTKAPRRRRRAPTGEILEVEVES